MTEDDDAKRPKMDDVTVELEVIQAVGRALAQLPDPDAQRRVLQWINDRFQPSGGRTDVGPRPGSGLRAPAEDAALGVDGLAEFFESPRATPIVHRDAVASEEPHLDSLVRGFVSDFQRVALEWQGA